MERQICFIIVHSQANVEDTNPENGAPERYPERSAGGSSAKAAVPAHSPRGSRGGASRKTSRETRGGMFGEGRGALNGRGRPERLPERPARGKAVRGRSSPKAVGEFPPRTSVENVSGSLRQRPSRHKINATTSRKHRCVQSAASCFTQAPAAQPYHPTSMLSFSQWQPEAIS